MVFVMVVSHSIRQWALLSVSLVLVGSVLGWSLYADHRRIDIEERDRLSTQATVIERNLNYGLLGTNQALESIRDGLPDLMSQANGQALVNRRLKALCDAMPTVRTMLIYDAQGDTIASNRQELIGHNFQEREYFRAARDGHEPDMLYVSQPFETALGNYSIAMSKVVLDEKGEFEGLIVAILDPEYFKVLLSSVNYTPDMWASLASSDGKLFLFVPEHIGTEGMDLTRPGTFFTRHRDSDQEAVVLTGVIFATGENRMGAIRTIKPSGLPMDRWLVVNVSRNMSSIFDNWSQRANASFAVFGLLTFIAAISLFLYQRRSRVHADYVTKGVIEREKLKIALDVSENRMRLAIEMANIAAWEYDFVKNQMSRSANHDGLYGLPQQDEWDINTFMNATHPDDRERGNEIIQASVAPGGPDKYAFDFRVCWAKGKPRWLWAMGEVVKRDSAGKGVLVRGILVDITDRKQSEAALIESESRYAILFSQAALPVVLSRPPDHVYIDVNDEWVRLFGYTREECIGRTSVQLGINRNIQLRQHVVEEVQHHHLIRKFEQTLYSKAGVPLTVLTNVNWISIDEQEYALTTLQDITERKMAENALKGERDLNQRYLDTVQVVLVALNGVGEITMVNRHGCQILGCMESDLIGRNWFATCLPQPEGLEVVYPVFMKMMAGNAEVAKNYENKIRCFDGKLRTIAWRNTYLTDADGAIIGALSSGQDITDQKTSQESLRLAGAVYQHSAEGIIVTDANVNIVAVNPAFTKITGFDAQEVLGKNPRLLQSGRHDIDFYRRMWAELTTHGHWQGEVWNRCKNGAIYPELLNMSVIRDENGHAINYLGVITDISDIKKVQEKLDFLAYHDPLTGLANRSLFNEFLQLAIQRASRQKHQFALLFMDLDRFKDVNDSLGHPIGDKLLIEIAQRLKSELRAIDYLSRISGDEFNLLLDQLHNPQDAGTMAERILNVIAQPVHIEGHEIYIGASIGIAVYPRDAVDIATLHRNADAALYQAKAEGRGTFRYFAKELAETAKERQALETSLRQAMRDGQLELHYQPQVLLADGKTKGVEALARWTSPSLGEISPVRFIPLAEETGLIVELGDWALKTACFQMRRWHDAGSPITYVAVNVSAVQLARGHLVESVRTALRESGIQAEQLELEITESFVMRNPDAAMGVLNELKALGVKMAIDDFGTGYSSLAYLKHLPVSRLKVDQGFVRDMLCDANDAAIVRAVIGLGHSLGLDVLAEGVETAEHAEALKALGCDSAQGWFYGRAKPGD